MKTKIINISNFNDVIYVNEPTDNTFSLFHSKINFYCNLNIFLFDISRIFKLLNPFYIVNCNIHARIMSIDAFYQMSWTVVQSVISTDNTTQIALDHNQYKRLGSLIHKSKLIDNFIKDKNRSNMIISIDEYKFKLKCKKSAWVKR